MKVGFTTLGCPDWEWVRVLQEAVAMKYDGLELRGVNGELNLPRAKPFLRQNLAATKRQLQELGLEVCCLGTSARFHEKETLDDNLALAKSHIDLAAELGAPFVRVFGDKISSAVERSQIVDQVANSLIQLADYAQSTGVKVVLETHGDFSRSADILEIMKQVSREEVGVLWDMHHPYRFFGEQPEETWQNISGYILHTHIKDSIGTKEDFHYCLIGEGDLPLRQCLQLLKNNGYDNWLVLEWEKKWHPEIEEPEVAFPQFREKIVKYWNSI